MLIEDYALLGDLRTAALVGRDGSLDWLCVPHFDSPSCFSRLLGTEEHGRWLLAPAAGGMATRRRYRPGTLVLESEWDVPEGTVRVIDFMPPYARTTAVVRVVEGVRGRVPVGMHMAVRLDYGSTIPWVTRSDGALSLVAGPDALRLITPVETHGEAYTTVAEFEVGEGDRVPFVLDCRPSHEPPHDPIDPEAALEETTDFWTEWSGRCSYDGPWRDEVVTSLVALKGMTYARTGAIVAAPTTSLPEALGGVRNWDYRYCWVRDAALTLQALLRSGYREEGLAFRDWLLRASAGHPAQLQIMYGLHGERRLPEEELGWLPGYEGSAPVRVGNAAADQFQLDTYGELVDAMALARALEGTVGDAPVRRVRSLLEFLVDAWHEPDEGIWEVRGPRRHFVHSKVMSWVAFDRIVRGIERFGVEAPQLDRWRRARAEIHAEVCERGYDSERGTFTQSYGSTELDASLLLIPTVGFLPGHDPRVRGTVEAIERELLRDGFVDRYRTGDEEGAVDGLPGREGSFLPCSLWLADAQYLTGRHDDARATFERVLGVANDLGLLAEEYDQVAGRLVGNFPQAFTHLAVVSTAWRLAGTPEVFPAAEATAN